MCAAFLYSKESSLFFFLPLRLSLLRPPFNLQLIFNNTEDAGIMHYSGVSGLGLQSKKTLTETGDI